MEDARWERYAALGGFAFVVLNVVGILLPGAPPAPDDSATKIASYFKDNAGKIEAGQVLALVATIGLLWWFGSLFRRLRAAEEGNPRLSVVALAGIAVGGSAAMMSGAVTSATALRIDEVGAASRFMYTLSMVMLSCAGVGVIAFLGAVCALNRRAGMFPMWTSYVGWLAAAGFAVGLIGAGSDSSAIGAVGLIAFLVWCVWIIAVSTMMWRGASAAP
jgi:hypothetical protein